MLRRIFLIATLTLVFVVPAFAGTAGGQADHSLLFIPGLIAFGLIINEASLAALFKNFNTLFNQALAAYKPLWPQIAFEVPSTTAQENYAWMGAFPKMRQWIGERQIKNAQDQIWVVANNDYEDTIGIKRPTIEDDQYGIFKPVITAQAIAAAQLWDDLVFALLNNGFTQKGYDGNYFFDTAHASGSNKDSGGGSVLSAATYATAIGKIKRQKDSAGNPLFSGAEAMTLIVSPENEDMGRKILNSDFISVASGSTQQNVWKGSANLVVAPKITSSTAWFITVDFMGLKPLIAQVRQQPEFVALVDPKQSDHVFKRNEYLYGTYARGNAGYGLHQLAYGAVGA